MRAETTQRSLAPTVVLDSLHSMSSTEIAADEELESLLAEHGPWLERTIRSLVPHQRGIDHDEVLQDVRLRVWKALRRGRVVDSPASYLYRAATTATIDAVRRVRARREEQMAGPEDATGGAAAWRDPQPGPERVARSTELGDRVRRAIDELPENRRIAVKLHLQGFNTTEIGDFLGWTEAKSRNLVSRGMKVLRASLREEPST